MAHLAPTNVSFNKERALVFAQKYLQKEERKETPLAIMAPPQPNQAHKRFKPSPLNSSTTKNPSFSYTVCGVDRSEGGRGKGLMTKTGSPYPGAPRLVCDPPLRGQPAGFFGDELPQKGPTKARLAKKIEELTAYVRYFSEGLRRLVPPKSS